MQDRQPPSKDQARRRLDADLAIDDFKAYVRLAAAGRYAAAASPRARLLTQGIDVRLTRPIALPDEHRDAHAGDLLIAMSQGVAR